MKKLAFLGVFGLVVGSSAFAGTSKFLCEQGGNGGNPEGYKVSLTLVLPAGSSGSSALLSVPGEAAARKLNCVIPAVDPSPKGNDLLSPLAFCNDGVADGGYSISVSTGGFAGWTLAEVQEKNFFQNKTVATLVCSNIK